jgi:hypothetical protein
MNFEKIQGKKNGFYINLKPKKKNSSPEVWGTALRPTRALTENFV